MSTPPVTCAPWNPVSVKNTAATQVEVRCEERAEEHRFARDEEDDRPHARGESRGLELGTALDDREAVTRALAATADDGALLDHLVVTLIGCPPVLARVVDEP